MKDEKFNPTLFTTFLIFYFGACGGLWHIGYWSTFDINFLQYIGLTDIIKDFAFPFATSLGVLLITFLFTTLSSYHDKIDDPNSVIYGKGRNTKTGIFLNKYVIIIISIYFSGLMFFSLFGGNIKWILLPFLISIPISIFLNNRNLLSGYIINPDIRGNVLNFLVVLPLISFCFAKKQSIEIFENHSFKSITSVQVSNDNNQTITKNLIGLKYLGSTPEKMFLTNLDNSEITILDMKNIDYITYRNSNSTIPIEEKTSK